MKGNSDRNKKYDQSRRCRKSRFNQESNNSALPAIQTCEENLNKDKSNNKRSKPCAFCNKDQNDDC